MRKRLQRVRDKLRKDIEMEEQRTLQGRHAPEDLPASIVELLARPRLVDLPENPVGACLAELVAAFPGFAPIELLEELMAWGEYAPWVLRAIGADPERHVALGAGFGLERVATLRYGIDDIRKVATISVA